MPVVIAAIVATLVLAPPNDPNPEKKWDLVSSIWALIGLVGAVLTIKELAHVPQNWAVIVGAAISSGIGCVLFVLRQRKLAEPIGIVYHFPSREALLASLQQHLADQWETALIEAAGAPVDRLTDAQRAAAYARVAATSADRAELLLVLEAATDPELAAPWTRLMEAWAPPAPSSLPMTRQQTDRLIAHLASDGLWVYDTITGTPLPPDVRAHLSRRIAELIEASGDPA